MFSVYAIMTYVMEIKVSGWIFLIPVAIAAVLLWNYSQNLSTHKIWAHPHFSAGAIAQFLYVAAQAGIFSFFINYMTSDLPAISDGFRNNGLVSWYLTDGLARRTGSGISMMSARAGCRALRSSCSLLAA